MFVERYSHGCSRAASPRLTGRAPILYTTCAFGLGATIRAADNRRRHALGASRADGVAVNVPATGEPKGFTIEPGVVAPVSGPVGVGLTPSMTINNVELWPTAPGHHTQPQVSAVILRYRTSVAGAALEQFTQLA